MPQVLRAATADSFCDRVELISRRDLPGLHPHPPVPETPRATRPPRLVPTMAPAQNPAATAPATPAASPRPSLPACPVPATHTAPAAAAATPPPVLSASTR